MSRTLGAFVFVALVSLPAAQSAKQTPASTVPAAATLVTGVDPLSAVSERSTRVGVPSCGLAATEMKL